MSYEGTVSFDFPVELLKLNDQHEWWSLSVGDSNKKVVKPMWYSNP